ncbi:MAG: hypothetical protein ACRDL8_17360, partial [Solirubrobacteraceae bacterium]
MTLSAAPTTASRRHRVATRVQDGATVEGDVVVLGSPGNVPRSALRGLIQPLSDCSVVLACAVEAGSETGRVRGTDLARRWLIRAEAPTELGPVALRSSALGGERRPGAIDIATLVELLRRGDAVTIDAGSLAPQGAPDQRRRWLAPAEVKAWLAAVDLAALAGDLAPEDELAATAALLRRAVLLPDLATA